jgi:hypothetical protein
MILMKLHLCRTVNLAHEKEIVRIDPKWLIILTDVSIGQVPKFCQLQICHYSGRTSVSFMDLSFLIGLSGLTTVNFDRFVIFNR